MKKFFAVLMTILMVLSLATMNVMAHDESEHSHGGQVYQPWDCPHTLPKEPGYYYLTKDVSLLASYYPADGTYICLNGHNITLEFSIIKIRVNGEFGITDCAEKAGNIKHATGEYGEVILVNCGGKFTMDGGKISGNEVLLIGGGGVCVNGGTFIMNDGEISGNIAKYGGGVYVYDGKFIMNGGKIANNMADSTYHYPYGGGVLVDDGEFIMNGGVISGNSAQYGGGVCLNHGKMTMTNGKIINNKGTDVAGVDIYKASFTMLGGEISGNVSNKVGGVYLEPDVCNKMTVGGNAKIINNKTTKQVTCNLVLEKGKQIDIITNGANELKNAKIGLTVRGFIPYEVSHYENTKKSASNFTSDNPCYIPYDEYDNDKGVNKVLLGYRKTVTFDNQGHGQSVDAVDIQLGGTIAEPDKLTADGWTFDGWYKEASCKNAWDFENDKVYTSRTLYAKWLPNPVATNFDFNTPENSKYDGTAKAATVTPKKGVTGMGTVTVYYSEDGKTWTKNAPVDAGTYKVKIDVALGSEYGVIESLTDDSWTFEIAKREVTITSGNASKAFDDKFLRCSDVKVSGDGFIEGEGVSYSFTGRQKKIGESANKFSYSFKVGTKESNYNITLETGLLVVTRTKLMADTKFITKDNVQWEEEQLVKDAIEEYKTVLKEETLTKEERDGFQDDLTRLEEALKALEHAKEVKDLVEQIPDIDNLKVEDKDLVDEINEKYSKLTDHEKELVGEDLSLEIQDKVEKVDELVDQCYTPEMLEGDDQKVDLINWGEKAQFRSEAPLYQFLEVKVDGQTIDPENYDLKEGSTIVILHNDFLNKLGNGTHTLDIVSQYGTATSTFTISNAWILLLFTMIVLSSIVAIVIILDKRKAHKA